MTKMHVIAKLALTLIGISLLNYLLSNFNILLIVTVGGDFYSVERTKILACVILLPIPFFIVYWLLFRTGWLVQKLAGPGGQSTQDSERIWLVAGFRLTLYFCGIMILSGCMEFLMSAAVFMIYGPKVIIDMIIYRYIDEIFAMPIRYWLELFSKFCKAALGIYLVLGAPRFVHWQMKQSNGHQKPEAVGTGTQYSV